MSLVFGAGLGAGHLPTPSGALLPLLFFEHSAGLLAEIDGADRCDSEVLALRVGHTEDSGQPIGAATSAHALGLGQNLLGHIIIEDAAHAPGRHLQGADRVPPAAVVVPDPGDQPPPQIMAADELGVALDLAPAHRGQAEQTFAALALHGSPHAAVLLLA
jgi:hypothetical protein